MSHFAGASWIQASLAIEIIYQIKKESCCVKKKLSRIDIDKLKAISSKNRFHEKRPIRCTVIVIAFFFLLVVLAFCFFREDLFYSKTDDFFWVFGAQAQFR